jgi:hypothetical protein
MKGVPNMAEYTEEEILNEIKTRPTVPVWPHYGWAHHLGRGKAYQVANRGGPEFLHIPGEKRKTLRAITAPLRKKLGIEA